MSDQPYWLAYTAALKVNYCDSYSMFVAGFEAGRAEQRRRDAALCQQLADENKRGWFEAAAFYRREGAIGCRELIESQDEAIEQDTPPVTAQPKERT